MMRRLGNRSGFTIIELMVGLVLFSVAGFAVMKVVTGSARTNRVVSEQVKQNSQLRNAATLIRHNLADADQLITVGWDNSSTPGSAPYGSDVVFTRSSTTGSTTTYVAEHVTYRSASDPTTALRNTITDQVKTSTTGYPDTTDWSESAAPSKVLVDHVASICTSASCSPGTTPLFAYNKDAVTPMDATKAGWQQKVGMMDLTLARDADGSGDQFSAQSLTTSVFLQFIGTHTQGDSSGGLAC